MACSAEVAVRCSPGLTTGLAQRHSKLRAPADWRAGLHPAEMRYRLVVDKWNMIAVVENGKCCVAPPNGARQQRCKVVRGIHVSCVNGEGQSFV